MRKPTKYKVFFSKFKNGQTSYERSLSMESLELLLILCSNVEVTQMKKSSGNILFTFPSGELNTCVSVRNLPLWILKKFVPEKEWKVFYSPKKKFSRPFRPLIQFEESFYG